MLYMGIFDTDPRATAQVNKDGEPIKKPAHVAPTHVIEMTETATLKVRGENLTLKADRRGYTPEAWERGFTYGEQRDVMDGAPTLQFCKDHTDTNEKGDEIPAPLNHDDEALKHAVRILNGYYTGEIVAKGSMDDATRDYRKNVYAAMITAKVTEEKIGKLGTTRASVTARAISAGFTQEQLDDQWTAALNVAETLKAAKGIKLVLPEITVPEAPKE